MRTETLTQGQLRELQQALLAERARLERFLPRAVHAGADLASGDDAEREDASTPSRTHTDARHHAVTEALRRLEDGTYGICTHCNGPIPFGRLIVMPESDHCVGCGPR